MDPAAYSSTVSGLVRLAWAAAVGKLVPTANPLMYGQLGGWQRQGSTGNMVVDIEIDLQNSFCKHVAVFILASCVDMAFTRSFVQQVSSRALIIALLCYTPSLQAAVAVRRASDLGGQLSVQLVSHWILNHL